uniref:Uncharacterized protein n=1 Tax=Ananas comosus var. bracteatus TaxID=296719 RepID=A0A6V7QNB3_ANACO|nr:unnamed protein product [Ananas comosus var. bracteatus]
MLSEARSLPCFQLVFDVATFESSIGSVKLDLEYLKYLENKFYDFTISFAYRRTPRGAPPLRRRPRALPLLPPQPPRLLRAPPLPLPPLPSLSSPSPLLLRVLLSSPSHVDDPLLSRSLPSLSPSLALSLFRSLPLSSSSSARWTLSFHSLLRLLLLSHPQPQHLRAAMDVLLESSRRSHVEVELGPETLDLVVSALCRRLRRPDLALSAAPPPPAASASPSMTAPTEP